jgi:hypothetical protein
MGFKESLSRSPFKRFFLGSKTAFRLPLAVQAVFIGELIPCANACPRFSSPIGCSLPVPALVRLPGYILTLAAENAIQAVRGGFMAISAYHVNSPS